MNTTRVLFIHGGGDGGYEADLKLADSLQKNLGDRYDVIAPNMPEPGWDAAEVWPKYIHEAAEAHQPDFIVGHSFGASNVLQYLVRYGTPKSLQGIFLVAPPFWGSDANWDFKEYELPTDFADKLSHKTPLFLYQCRDDEVVDIAHIDRYAKAMPWATVRKFDHGGHQIGNDFSVVAKDIAAIAL